MADNPNTLSDKFYTQVSESIQNLFELTTRVDERVKVIIEKQTETDNKFKELIVAKGKIVERLAILENNNVFHKIKEIESDIKVLEDKACAQEKTIASLKEHSGNIEEGWKTLINFGLQLVWAVLACYVIYKLGLQDSIPP